MRSGRDSEAPDVPGAPDERSGWRLGFVSGILFFASVIGLVAYLASLWVSFNSNKLDSPRMMGAPLRIVGGDGAGVYLLTSQEETRVLGGGSRFNTVRGFEKVLHVDVWRLDAASMRTVWRKRLLSERNWSIFDIALMGVDRERLWIFLREPLVVSLANGEVLADAAAIEARNAPLKGVLPRQMGHYKFFDGHGLVFTAADARAWVLDPQTLNASPWQAKTAKPRAEAVAPAYFVATSLTSFQKRGLLLTKAWLGVLTDDEAAALNRPAEVPGAKPGERRGAAAAFFESMQAPPDLSHAGAKRYRLWRAKVEQVSAAPAGWPKNLPDNWGKRPKYSDFTVFEKSPEFLQAGLLGDGRSKFPLLPTKPDSVLVLHRDRIDEDGRLRVTRFAGPDGRVLWDTPLPLSLLHSSLPGESALVLYGRAYLVDRPPVGDPYHSAHEWLISIDLPSGMAKSFNLSTVDEDK